MAVKSLKSSTVKSLAKVSNSASAGYSFHDFYHLETVQISSSTSTITFSNLLQYSDFQHLQLRVVGRTDRSGLDRDICGMRFNGDSGNNYNNHRLLSTGAALLSGNSGATSSIEMTGYTPGATATSGRYAAYIMDILDSYESKNKVVRILSNGKEQSGESGGPNLSSGVWVNTAAIYSISLTSLTGANWVSGSRFSLYGVR